jgi:hypothetical protein
MTLPAQKRGWVEIIEGEGREIAPFRHEVRFQVYDWTESKDAGAMVADFATRQEAVAFAVDWSVTHGRRLQSADVFPFRHNGKAVEQ